MSVSQFGLFVIAQLGSVELLRAELDVLSAEVFVDVVEALSALTRSGLFGEVTHQSGLLITI